MSRSVGHAAESAAKSQSRVECSVISLAYGDTSCPGLLIDASVIPSSQSLWPVPFRQGLGVV